MKKILTISILLINLILLSCNNQSSSSYNDNKQDASSHEKNNPTSFLSIDNIEENIWGSKIKSTISNSASLTTYKDIVIEINFLSKTNSIIKTENITIYEYFSPNSKKSINFKIPNYKGTKKISCKIIDASYK